MNIKRSAASLMNVRVVFFKTGEKVNALIRKGELAEMPSMQQGWRFNFDKELKKLKNAAGYLLLIEEMPDVIEGCMIFQMINKEIPYMAYVEIAPHNKTGSRKYDHVAGCLIAFAFKLSIMYGTGDYNGMLKFSVSEQKQSDQIKLMALYSGKYNAVRIGNTNKMFIYDEAGEELIERYLN